MRKIYIPKSDLPRFGSYQMDVLEYGHIPGHLSGASLKGDAKKWGAKYQQSRAKVIAFVKRYFDYAIDAGMYKGKRVWMDILTNEPVEICIQE